MKELLDLTKNVQKGPKTSIVGALLLLGGSYMIYASNATLTYMSIEVGIFVTGLYLFLTSDTGWFKKKEEDAE